VLIFLVAQRVYGQDTTILVTQMDGITSGGELLSVRDSSLVIDTSNNESQAEGGVAILNYTEIREVVIRRASILPKAMLVGFLVGAIPGGALGAWASGENYSDWPHETLPGIARGVAEAGGVGLAFGTIVGIATPHGDEQVDIKHAHGIMLLKHMAKYQTREPDWLRVLR
jgi:hypothetical protein